MIPLVKPWTLSVTHYARKAEDASNVSGSKPEAKR
jgi:hypothetical protein